MWTELGAGGLSLLGAWYDQRNDEKNMHEQNTFNAEQAAIDRSFQATQAQIDRDLQRDFAENGIRMRVADAVAAGLHPLVGAGVNPVQFSPVGVGGSRASSSGYSPSHMGQDISRAIQAVRTPSERAEDELKLQLLRSQIAETDMRTTALLNEIERKSQSAGSAGPFPEGAGQVTVVPVQKMSQNPDDASTIAGDHALWQDTYITPDLKWRLPASQGENPMESLEGTLPQLLTLYKNLYYDKKMDPNSWIYKIRQAGQWYRKTMRPFRKSYR